jgi:hypothetical protein
VQTLAQLLATGAAFDLEVTVSRFTTVMGKTEKVEALRFPTAFLGALSSKTPKFQALRLLFRQAEPELFEPHSELGVKTFGILSVLKAG